MILIGKNQTLLAVRNSEFGMYFAHEDDLEDQVLLPNKQVPEAFNVGDELGLFVYNDHKDRPVATTSKPMITLGGLARLKVVSITKIGAFLDWGLHKDLFLPFKEQKGSLEEGASYLVTMYLDKSHRLCASMHIYDTLNHVHSLKKDDWVQGIVYDLHSEYGVFVAVEDKYHGLIPKKDVFKKYQIGEDIEARVTEVRESGKLILSTKKKAYLAMDSDSEMILTRLEEAGGYLPYHDKSDPAAIKKEFKISKRAFKRAIGSLYKDKQITILDHGIQQRDDNVI